MTASLGYGNPQNYPPLKQSTDRVWIQNSYADSAVRMDYSGTNLIYVGNAVPGADPGALVWQIKNLQYNGSGQLTAIVWPENAEGRPSSDYAFSWTARASYTFA